MITLFTIPKAFEGHTATIQRNAIASWATLEGVDVLLIGDDGGVAEVARELGVRHEPNVKRTALGTPLVSSAFATARAASRQGLIGYVNADIVMLPDFASAVGRVRMSDFLLAGQRWNTDLAEPINFSQPGWEARIRDMVRGSELAGPLWVDYFVMPKESALVDLPPFAVGRPWWDNWLVRRARQAGIPVVDATKAITAVHQKHDHTHIPGGLGQEDGYAWAGPEEEINRELFGDGATFGVGHATHVIRLGRVVPALGIEHLRRRWGTRHDADGIVERVGRQIEPALVPALRLKNRVLRSRAE